MRDQFPDPISFQRGLSQLGYEIDLDGNVLSEETTSTVHAFQLDWNVVARAFELGEPIDTSGYIDVLTVSAIAAALASQRSQNTDWFNIVTEALGQLRPEVG